MDTWLIVVLIIGALVVGLVIGFLITRTVISRHLKKNPPINEKMIRAMFQSMGRKASEKQIRQVMSEMTKHQ